MFSLAVHCTEHLITQSQCQRPCVPHWRPGLHPLPFPLPLWIHQNTQTLSLPSTKDYSVNIPVSSLIPRVHNSHVHRPSTEYKISDSRRVSSENILSWFRDCTFFHVITQKKKVLANLLMPIPTHQATLPYHTRPTSQGGRKAIQASSQASASIQTAAHAMSGDSITGISEESTIHSLHSQTSMVG